MAIDLQRVKDAAAGKWPDILTDVGGIDPASLDGRHGPCPQCGGKDRFRALDLASGALFCNRCFNQKNGDGLGAVGWLRGWTLPESIDAVASYLHLSNGSGSQHQNPGTPGKPEENEVMGFRGSPKKLKTYPSKAAAVEAVNRMIGQQPTGQWDYHDKAGQVVAAVLRFDLPNGDKTYRPVSMVGNGWALRGPEPPRGLYRLPELAEADRVFLCEGEKASDAGRSIGLVCTTSPNGAQAPGKADWTPLAGKDVILCPDADGPGEEYAATVAGILDKMEPRPRIKVLRLDGLEEGDDLFDWMEARDAMEPATLAETLNALADNAEEWQPTPCESEAKPDTSTAGTTQQRTPPATWRAFPVDALPEPVAGFIHAGARAIGCDASYIALPLLAGLGSAIGNARRIELKPGWAEPSIIWCAVVAESGTSKSPAMELALRPIRARQREAMAAYRGIASEHATAMVHYEKDLAAWKREKGGGDPPEKPEEPTAGRVWCDDTTLESLAVLLQQNPRGLLCARDELAGWLGSFDRYSNGKGGDAAKWLELWAGRSIVVDRKTGHPKMIFIPRASVCLAGCIQPGTLRRCMGPEHIESGMAARILFAAPPKVAKRWTEACIDRAAESMMAGLFHNLYAMEPMGSGDGPEPVALRLDRSAKECWIEFYNEHAQEAAKLSGELAATWAKLEAYAARLSLIVHCVRSAGSGSASDADVDAMSVASGITLARWFGHEAKRVYSMLNETNEDEERRGLVEKIKGLGGRCTPRDFRHHGFKGDAEAAENALAELVKAGYGRWEPVPPGASGGRPTRAFVLND